MVAQGTGHRRKLTVPLWGDRMRGRGVVALRTDVGQASVETVGLIPAYIFAALMMGQGAVAGYTAWSAAGAARIAARAEALGEDPKPAARAELPAFLRDGSNVLAADADGAQSGRVTVKLRIPSLLPGMDFGTVRGRAQLPNQAGA